MTDPKPTTTDPDAFDKLRETVDFLERHLQDVANHMDVVFQRIDEVERSLRSFAARFESIHPTPSHGNCPKCHRRAVATGRCGTCGHTWRTGTGALVP